MCPWPEVQLNPLPSGNWLYPENDSDPQMLLVAAISRASSGAAVSPNHTRIPHTGAAFQDFYLFSFYFLGVLEIESKTTLSCIPRPFIFYFETGLAKSLLKFTILLPQPLRVLGSQACTTMPSQNFIFKYTLVPGIMEHMLHTDEM